MKRKELQDWLIFDGNIEVQMPNEIFEDFNKIEIRDKKDKDKDELKFDNWKHRAFAYTYYYITTYIYRNVLYSISNNPENYSQDAIISSITPSRTKVSYITKKNGLLEQIGCVKTTNNFPVSYFMEDEILMFSYINELKEQLNSNLLLEVSPNFTAKEPIKGLKRFDDEWFTGTFYNFYDTHLLPIKVYIDIMSDDTDDSTGITRYVAIYVYGYLSMMCGKFKEGYVVSNAVLAKILGCNERTLTRYTKYLEQRGLLSSKRKKYMNKEFEKAYTINK